MQQDREELTVLVMFGSSSSTHILRSGVGIGFRLHDDEAKTLFRISSIGGWKFFSH